MSSQQPLEGFDTEEDFVRRLDMAGRVERAIKVIKANEPPDGYFLAFSGGKDSCAIKALAKLAGVKFDAFYSQTTIDPPELVQFIKKTHPDVKWILPKHGNMMSRVATRQGTPPTRMVRWCCEEYKEQNSSGRVTVLGVRTAESRGRRLRWSEVTRDHNGTLCICPICFWSDENLWEFMRGYKVDYCKLYDEGWDRLGCVGCPLNPKSQKREFERWPKFRDNWKRAIIKNWELWKDVPRNDGRPRFHAKFATGEDFWLWWLNESKPDLARGDCQSMQLWTNIDGATETEIQSFIDSDEDTSNNTGDNNNAR